MKRFLKIYINILTIAFMLNATIAYADTTSAVGDIKDSLVPILRALSWFGYAIAFGMLLYIGAKYAMAPANDKANLKEGLVNYIIGVFLIAGASTIAAIFSGIASSDVSGTLHENLIQQAENLTKTAN